MLTLAQLVACMPGVNAGYLDPINIALDKSECMTSERIAMWLAQWGHETMNFHYLQEIASGVTYEGRKDLGNTQPGDGVRYKGRGICMLTGRSNYTMYTACQAVDFVRYPELLSRPEHAFNVGAWFWVQHSLNKYADNRDIKGATKVINGGYNGLDDRSTRYTRACKALGI